MILRPDISQSYVSGDSTAWHDAHVPRVDDQVGDPLRLPALHRHRLTMAAIPVVAGFGPAIETPMIDR
jgi:hypothetical protein